ncbi:S1C family serine protease, partial [Enterococcus faecium]
SEQAKPVIDTLMKGQSVKRGYLGVQLQPLDEDAAAAVGLKKNEGEIVGSVVAGQPADKAGVKPGDIIVRVNGQQVTVDTTVSYITARTAPGTPIKLDVLR